jgi:hypothetical protein
VPNLRGKTGAFRRSQGNSKTCDNISSGAPSEPVLSDSLSQPLMLSDALSLSALNLFGQILVILLELTSKDKNQKQKCP